MMQNLDDTKTISSATITCTPINVGETYSSYYTPTKMTLREFMKKWLNDEIGDGFKFIFILQEKYNVEIMKLNMKIYLNG